MAFNARSTRPTHEAQVMPSIGRLKRVATRFGGSRTAWMGAEVMELALQRGRGTKLKDCHDGKVKD